MSDDEEALTDYIDGRLGAGAKSAFERRLAAEPGLARRLKLALAAKSALAASVPLHMPGDLKAALKRRARERVPRPTSSWMDAWGGAFTAPAWAYGIGAAFAAAAFILLARGGAPKKEAAPTSAPVARWSDTAAAEGLQDLWSDDSGADDDQS